MSKLNQIWYGVYHGCLECKTKRIFVIACPGKKVRISIGNIDLFAYSIFENIEISSGQGVVQIRPNLVWSIPWVPRVNNKMNFWYSLPRKKDRISIGNIDLFAYSIFENIENSSGQGVVQIKPNLMWSIPCVSRVYSKKNFRYSLPRKKFVFRSEISTYSHILFSKI